MRCSSDGSDGTARGLGYEGGFHHHATRCLRACPVMMGRSVTWPKGLYGRHTKLLFVHISSALMCLLTTRLESTAALAYVESMGETMASQSFSTS